MPPHVDTSCLPDDPTSNHSVQGCSRGCLFAKLGSPEVSGACGAVLVSCDGWSSAMLVMVGYSTVMIGVLL